MTITDLKPELIWGIFHEITQVPRPSKKEEKIREYLLDFAKKHGIEAKTDAIGNVAMRVPATPGKENIPTVVMQSHMDMVPNQTKPETHNFETDPIKTEVDGEWLHSAGYKTTLGADNGIGMAAALAVLADKELKHGRIQALFTVDEETGLTGAFGLEAGMIDGKYLLNLDSEDEAEIFIGCAGGIDTTSTFTYKQEPLPAGKFYLRVEVKNLLGGHSGGDIHLGRGNANKLLARFLWLCMQRHEIHLCAIDGGNLRNAIPREAMAVIAVNPEDKEAIRAEVNHFAADVAAELSGVDPQVTVDVATADTPAFMIEDGVARSLVSALYAAPHGVIAMSHDIEGLVETSTNLASVKMTEPGKIVVATSQRSSVESEKYDIAYQVECLFRMAGAEPSHGDGYPGWKPNMHSHIKDIAVAAYEELYQQTPAIKAIHAGLECGLFLTKYPQLDMISFGPTLRGVHSPDEMMHIPAVEKFWNHLVLILEKVAAEH